MRIKVQPAIIPMLQVLAVAQHDDGTEEIIAVDGVVLMHARPPEPAR